MADEILINVTLEETRVARIQDGILREIRVERCEDDNTKRVQVGDIYQGKVKRIAHGIEAAFIDIGLKEAGFLSLNKMDTVPDEGDTVLVQVIKESVGLKGIRLTMQLKLASRYLLLTPHSPQIHFSQKITDLNQRVRLREGLTATSAGGYIIRTLAMDATTEEILADQSFLIKKWEAIQAAYKNTLKNIPHLIDKEIPLALRILRDDVKIGSLKDSIKPLKIRVDHAETADAMRVYAKQHLSYLVDKIEYYTGSQPIFDQYGIEKLYQHTLHRKVYLKSGGYLIFDQTEAMHIIDVNSGGYISKKNGEETAYQTNVEAIGVIAQQIQLRNLGGIIIIDFIDMNDRQHQSNLMLLLKKAFTEDNVRTDILELTRLGLVQMTRKRTRESLEQLLCEPCIVCYGRGSIKSIETLCYEILRALQQTAHDFDWKGFLVLAAKEVIDYINIHSELKNRIKINKNRLENRPIDRPIEWRIEASYVREKYAILPLDIL